MSHRVLQNRLPAIDISYRPPKAVVLDAGTTFVVEIGKFEWLGREGLYSEISLPKAPGARFRVRYQDLFGPSGVGSTGDVS